MEKIYIIGDIHGCYNTLLALVKKLPKNAKLCFVGDLIDRGEDSQKVVEFVRKNNHYCVMGNHELAMKEEAPKIIKDSKQISINKWTSKQYNYGGINTLKSYRKLKKLFNSENLTKVFKEDIEWMNNLPLYLEFKDIKDENGRYLVVSHSSVHDKWDFRNNSKISDEYKKFTTKVLFSRVASPFDNPDIYNVFGHTPVAKPKITDHFANIDTGCVYSYVGKQYELGILTAMEFPSRKIIQQENID